MSRLLLCCSLTVVLGFAGSVPGDDAEGDSDKLQGTWQATEGEANGNPLPKEQLLRMKVVFSGEKMSIFPPDGDGKRALENTFKLDPTQTPKALDATRVEGGKIAKGIYELDGDTLKLCLPIRLEKERPTEFAAPKKSEVLLLTLNRVKK